MGFLEKTNQCYATGIAGIKLCEALHQDYDLLMMPTNVYGKMTISIK